MTLREHMSRLEGDQHTAWAIGHGFNAWIVDRQSPTLHRTDTITVFAKSPSDARRKASSPARLGEECHGDIVNATKINGDWDHAFMVAVVAGSAA